MYIVWGESKSHPLDLGGGETALLCMRPGNDADLDANLHVSLKIDGKEKFWNRTVAPHESGTRTSVQVWINERGAVDERHCLEPCEYTLPWYEPWLSSLWNP